MFWFWRKQEAKAAGQDVEAEGDEATQADQPVESKLRRLLADLDDDASDHSDDSYIFLNEGERNDEEGAQDPSGPSTEPNPTTSDLPSTASGKGKGKGPPPPSKGSGKGKGKAPPPAGKGVKGKGKASAPPPPKGAGKAEPKSQPKGPALPIGRRLSLKPSSVTAEAFNLVTARGEERSEAPPRPEEELVDLAELHETFAAAPTQAIKTKIRARRKEILPRGIAQNVAIALARLGQGATENLAAALRALSGEGASLGVPADEVSRLLEVWPDEKVLAPLKDFALSEADPEPLRDVEKQLLPLLVIPRVRQRLRLLVLADMAEKRVGEALDQLQLLRRACYEIQNSSLLRELLAIIVLLFNYVNFGAAPEKAQVTSSLKGVDVPSLLRLRETKASKGDFPGFHMLHFVVKQLLKQRASWKKEKVDEELPSLRRACKVHMERLNSELQELKGDYFFVQTEFQEHREEYHGSDSSDEEVEPSTEHPNWGFLDKLLARGLDFANLAEAWLRGDEVLGRPYHPSVGCFAAFDSLQGEDGSAPPGWLWLCRPSGRWQRCWSEVRGPVLVLYKVELHHCTGATYVTLPGALLADGNKEEMGKDEAHLCQEGDSEDSGAPKDGASFELITAGSNGRLLRLCASSRKQAASWRRVFEQVAKRPGAGYLSVSGPGQSEETLFCAAAGDEFAAYERPRDALEAMSPRWRLGRDFTCRRTTAVSFQLVKQEELWNFGCQDISDAQRWFDYFSSLDRSEGSQASSPVHQNREAETEREKNEDFPQWKVHPHSPIAEEPSSEDETVATASPRENRVETLAQLELTLAGHVNRFEQAFRSAEDDCRELLRFFGLEDSRFGASSLLESLNDFCGQLRSAWDDLEKAQQRSIRLQTPRKTPRKTPRSGSLAMAAMNSSMKDDDTIQQWRRIWNLHSTGPITE